MRAAPTPAALWPAALTLVAGCAWNAAGSTGCQPLGPPRPLPEILEESSGVAWSGVHPDVLWSHNDGGHDAAVYALDPEGRLLATIPVHGPENRDWEDLSTAGCGGGSCIYLADTGDNAEERPRVDLHRFPEPATLDGDPVEAETFPLLFPDGPRDVEAVFVLPGERVFFITKGRNHPVTVYRYPPPLTPGEPVTLEEVQTLTDGPAPLPSQVTGAGAVDDGSIVAVRSYEALTFYAVEDGRLTPLEEGRVNLRTLEEPQGEAVDVGPEGRVALTTEAGNFGGVAALRLLECSVVK